MSLTRKVTSLGLVAVAVMLVAGLAKGQGSVIGGGDDDRNHDHIAWFVGAERTVSFCIAREESFPASEADLARYVANAFRQWSDYARDRGHLSEAGADSPRRIATRTAFNGPCDLSIDSAEAIEDLRFYFGTDDRGVRERMPFFHNPSAFAVRTAYDLDRHWGRGFVWFRGSTPFVEREVAPLGRRLDWTSPGVLETMLLHEIGHVLGIGHVPQTVMRQDIVEYLYEGQGSGAAFLPPYATSSYPRQLGAIDHERQLLLANASYKAAVTSVSGRDFVEILTGREPSGLPRVSLDLRSKPTLLLHEDGREDVTIRLERYSEYMEDGRTWVPQATVFKKLLGTASLPRVATEMSGSIVQLYRADLPAGRRALVEVQLNTHPLFSGIVALLHEGRYIRQYLRIDPIPPRQP